MEMNVGTRLHGFTVTRVRENREINGRMVEMRHDKTGGELVWLDNGEENKVFSITFFTPPTDSTGVFHILEHSVLCGSDKYPIKDPFVELIKGSMNTFLNALTASDWTSYPVSSRNDKDYLNLMGVYLDAVFCPKLRTDKRIFLQEGHRIEKTDAGEYAINGVVYNEMKGAMADVDRLIEHKTLETLFPDNCYRFVSGGDPAVIPSLTYEDYRDTYLRHYHPANARVYLDGAVPIEETLGMIDSYYARYDAAEPVPPIPLQQPVSRESVQYYDPGADTTDKACMTLDKITGTFRDRVRDVMLDAITTAIAGSDESPLKKAMLEDGLMGNMDLVIDEDLQQHYVHAVFREIRDGRMDEVLPRFRETVRKIVENGIPREDLVAALDQMEFKVREPEEPAGLIRLFSALDGWLYGGDPMDGMLYDELFAKARAALQGDAYEKLLKEAFLDEEGQCVVRTLPDADATKKAREREEELVLREVDDWDETVRRAVDRQNEELLKWQETPDSPEDIAKLPMLRVSDLKGDVYHVPTEEKELNGVRLLFHRRACHGVVYIRAYFPLDIPGDIASPEEIARVATALTMFGRLRTTRHAAQEIERLGRSLFGSLSLSILPIGKPGDRNAATPYICCYFSSLTKNVDKAIALMTEILTETCFDEDEKIARFIRQADQANQERRVARGYAYALATATSRYSASMNLRECLTGATSVKELHRLAENIDENFRAVCEGVRNRLFTGEGLIVSVTAEEEPDASDGSAFGCFLSKMRGRTRSRREIPFTPGKECFVSLPFKAAYRLPAQTGFTAQAWNIREAGYRYSGDMKVLANVLTYSHLWNEVRVKGGAYGTGMVVTTGGHIYARSYRDPSPLATISVNKTLSDAIRHFAESGESLDKYIISTIAAEEPLASPSDDGSAADIEILNSRTLEDKRRERSEMLAVTVEKLASYAPLLERFAAEGACAIVAGTVPEEEYEVSEL